MRGTVQKEPAKYNLVKLKIVFMWAQTFFSPCYTFCSIVLLVSLVNRFRHGALHFFAQLNHKKSILEVREFL